MLWILGLLGLMTEVYTTVNHIEIGNVIGKIARNTLIEGDPYYITLAEVRLAIEADYDLFEDNRTAEQVAAQQKLLKL